jgi:hypothetical protein
MSACFQFKEAQTIAQAAAAEKGKRSPGMKKGIIMKAKSYKAPAIALSCHILII